MEEITQEITEEMKKLKILLENFSRIMTKKISNEEVYLKQLKERNNFLTWTIDKYKTQFKGVPNYVYKRDVFYCKLGYNIGSEQKDKRPVVILQNDRGNYSSQTTIIAPITTHKNCVVIEDNGEFYYEFINDYGKKIKKKLDYYEIPLEVEEKSKQKIIGYINLAQIRTISMKRLSKTYVAKITEDTDNKIKEAMDKLFSH